MQTTAMEAKKLLADKKKTKKTAYQTKQICLLGVV